MTTFLPLLCLWNTLHINFTFYPENRVPINPGFYKRIVNIECNLRELY